MLNIALPKGRLGDEALRLLAEITGRDATEEVIDSVFANFCVGK